MITRILNYDETESGRNNCGHRISHDVHKIKVSDKIVFRSEQNIYIAKAEIGRP